MLVANYSPGKISHSRRMLAIQEGKYQIFIPLNPAPTAIAKEDITN